VSAWFESHLFQVQLCFFLLIVGVRVLAKTDRKLILKRFTVWLLESLSETFLLSVLFIAYGRISFGADQQSNYVKELSVMMVAVAVVFMFASGYMLTTALCGVVWRASRPWVYPAIAAVLYLGHLIMVFGAGRWGVSLNHWALSQRVTLEAGGASTVFTCTFIGGHFLRKWVETGTRSHP
jgi:hypothetical protein